MKINIIAVIILFGIFSIPLVNPADASLEIIAYQNKHNEQGGDQK